MRAPGNATIGNTPNKSIIQRVAKNTFSPRPLHNFFINDFMRAARDGGGWKFIPGNIRSMFTVFNLVNVFLGKFDDRVTILNQ